jgi:cysteine-rich repeat protein
MIEVGGGTNMTAGIEMGHSGMNWAGLGTPATFIFLSDGVPNGDTPQAALQAATEVRDDDITLFTIGLGEDADTDLLRQIASSPNLFYESNISADLIAIYQTIAARSCCGDGIVEPDFAEQCDDGNRIDNDGCSASCQWDYVDVGLRLPENGEIVSIAIERGGTPSPLRIAKGGVVYNISLTDVDAPDATNIRIQTSNDGIKAIRKIVPVESGEYMMLFD